MNGLLQRNKNNEPLTSCIKHWGLRGLTKDSAPHRRLCRRIGTKPATPNVSYTQPLCVMLEEHPTKNETMLT